MAKKTSSTPPASDRAFLRGAVRARRSPKASPGDAALAKDKGRSPEAAFLTGSASPSKAGAPGRAKPKAPSVRHPKGKHMRAWGCTKCGYRVDGDVVVPLCPMCEPEDFVEQT